MKNHGLENALIILVLMLLILFVSVGCAQKIIASECKQLPDTDSYLCNFEYRVY